VRPDIDTVSRAKSQAPLASKSKTFHHVISTEVWASRLVTPLPENDPYTYQPVPGLSGLYPRHNPAFRPNARDMRGAVFNRAVIQCVRQLLDDSPGRCVVRVLFEGPKAERAMRVAWYAFPCHSRLRFSAIER
jgi:hypothetical protein